MKLKYGNSYLVPVTLVLPYPSQKEPAGQAIHSVNCFAPKDGRYVPGGHLLGIEVPDMQYDPAGQRSPYRVPTGSASELPAWMKVEVEYMSHYKIVTKGSSNIALQKSNILTLQKYPGEHGPSGAVNPDNLQKCPGSHGVHALTDFNPKQDTYQKEKKILMLLSARTLILYILGIAMYLLSSHWMND